MRYLLMSAPTSAEAFLLFPHHFGDRFHCFTTFFTSSFRVHAGFCGTVYTILPFWITTCDISYVFSVRLRAFWHLYARRMSFTFRYSSHCTVLRIGGVVHGRCGGDPWQRADVYGVRGVDARPAQDAELTAALGRWMQDRKSEPDWPCFCKPHEQFISTACVIVTLCATRAEADQSRYVKDLRGRALRVRRLGQEHGK